MELILQNAKSLVDERIVISDAICGTNEESMHSTTISKSSMSGRLTIGE
jgi:hypothetical protein